MTDVALMRFYVVMNKFVTFQIAHLFKCLGTDVALKGLFICVHPCVHLQSIFVVERFVADVALE